VIVEICGSPSGLAWFAMLACENVIIVRKQEAINVKTKVLIIVFFEVKIRNEKVK
jgi:hypothetical protein